jgi:hypothetical protein
MLQGSSHVVITEESKVNITTSVTANKGMVWSGTQYPMDALSKGSNFFLSVYFYKQLENLTII